MGEVTLRQASDADSEFAYQTKRAAFRQYVEEAFGWDEAKQRANHDTRFTSQNFRIIQAGGVDVGILASVEEPDRIKLNQIFILPEYHGKGIGTACMQIVMEEARDRELPIELRVLHNNPRAITFYRRLGFVAFDRSRTHLHLRNDPE